MGMLNPQTQANRTKTPTNQTKTPNKRFWEIKASEKAADGTTAAPAELILYGDISTETWYGDEVTPKVFDSELAALGDVDEIVVRINSGGGDVFAANAIYTRLKDHKAKITVKIDGWAASAATIIAMAGDTILIPANGVFMIHNPLMGVHGYYGAEDFVKLSEELAVIKQSIINGYCLKTGKDETEISALMDKETWLDGKQAVDSGFCDKLMFADVQTKVENASRIFVNSMIFDLTEYSNIPKSLLNCRTKGESSENGDFTNINTKTEKGGLKKMETEIKTVNELKAAYPELTAQIETNAIAAERKRIQDIENVALPGYETIVSKAKFESPVGSGEVAMQIIAKQREQGKNYLAGVSADVNDSGMKDVKSAAGDTGANETNPFDAAIDRLFPVK
ncbi:MAG: Clp protease ClpP [Ruminococcus sp.]|nr:Clp protease ClpP [Ruminococcus sp.]